LKKIGVGVTCVGSLISQGIIKSIRQSDLKGEVELTGFEYFPDTIGSYWVERTYLMPDILKKGITEEEYLAVLKKHILDHGIRFLFIGMDFELPMMSRNRARIRQETGCDVISSSPEVIETADDKYLTFEFLKRHSLPFPRTWLPGEEEAIRYPAIVKPRTGERSRNVHLVKDAKDLREKLPTVGNPVIQEAVGTRDREYTCGILFLDEEVRTRIFLRRYLRDGNTSLAFHSPGTPDSVREYVEEIAKRLRPYGPCNFQLRLGEDGVPRLFEINARFSGTTYMRTLFGMNEVAFLLHYLMGENPRTPQLRYGKILRYPEEFYVADPS